MRLCVYCAKTYKVDAYIINSEVTTMAKQTGKIVSFKASFTELAYVEQVAKTRGVSISRAVRDCISQCRDDSEIEGQYEELNHKFDSLIDYIKPLAQQAVQGR